MDWQYYKDCLEKAGISFDKGLSNSEIYRTEEKFEFTFPPDLREFLQFALPIGKKWIDWRNDDDKIKFRLNWPYDGICFDIEHNAFWLKEWGEKPNKLEDAFGVAKNAIAKAPILIPIFSHRYIPDKPNESGNPIFSVYQTDIIIYGSNLPSYLRNEFSYYFEENFVDIQERKIEFWSRLVELNE